MEGGLLFPIMTADIEEYLLGVVPYEMSDSFPLEALKAQAICARTYAMDSLNSKRAWDMDDTTSYQVFKGIDARYTNAQRAIRETSGLVGTYKGKLASCYYAASNGGQTETMDAVWDSPGDWGYYQRQDDPYDLENPESVVRSVKLPRNGGNYPRAFMSLLRNALKKEMQAAGYDPTYDTLRIDSISSLTLSGAPKGSRRVTKMTLTFTWSGRSVLSASQVEEARLRASATTLPNPDGEEELSLFATNTPVVTTTPLPAENNPSPSPTPSPTPAPVYGAFEASQPAVTLTLDLFPETVQALGLGINGKNHPEMVSLRETQDAFVL